MRDGLRYIGKEANNIDDQVLGVKRPQVFVDVEMVKERILKMTYKEGEALGINRGSLWRMKKKAKSGKPFTMNAHVRGRLAAFELRE